MGYIVIGILWCWWLEWYTTKNPSVDLPRQWIWRERIFHTFLWPFSLTVFLIEFFRHL